MLQLNSKVYQNAVKKNSFAFTIKNPTNVDKQIPLISFVFHRHFKLVQSSDQLKPLQKNEIQKY